MHQGHALELYFDDASEQRITRSIPSTPGGASILDLGARPHISLALFVPSVDQQAFIDIAEALARIVPEFMVWMSAVAVFPGDESVIYPAPSITPELMAAHRAAHDLIDQARLPTDPLYQSARWVPHCTMLMGVPGHLIGSQVEMLHTSEACGSVNIVSAGVISFRPVVEIAQFGLTG